MGTFLFDEIVFGPVTSRRLGVSLGINLLPTDSKLCNFNCIYCECGWTKGEEMKGAKFHSRELVKESLKESLSQMKAENKPLDAITFAGNGEPTMHPKFSEIIDDTIELKNKYYPDAIIAVLSNATMIHKDSVFNALKKIKNNILKLDSAIEKTYNLINGPVGGAKLDKIIDCLIKFEGDLIVQTMFLRGTHDGQVVDNTTDKEINAWLEALKMINPRQVMIYSIARDTPAPDLHKVAKEELMHIAIKVKELGIDVTVSA